MGHMNPIDDKEDPMKKNIETLTSSEWAMRQSQASKDVSMEAENVHCWELLPSNDQWRL
jgi:hypothetical protein